MTAEPAGPAVTDPGHTRPYRSLSYWHGTLPPDDLQVPRPALPGDVDVDVAVVGAGFTGLWTAYYLLAADPTLRVVVLERNGGTPPADVIATAERCTIAGNGACRTTRSATLPMNRCANPVRPWVPITTRSMPAALA